jgi:hypothetical protein
MNDLLTSGQAALRVGLPRWRLLYLIEKGEIPGPSYQVPGRRLFTPADLDRIAQALARRPEQTNRAASANDV